jgi:NhaP-type Na+/H+ or K+/H+ antiporter
VGATLSATDPVTILAIFNTYKVDPKLYTIIFGESILNDAVAIVLFETAQRYKDGGSKGSGLGFFSLLEGVGIFLLVFFGSLMIGVTVGICTALGLKYTLVRRYPKIESCLIVLIAYASYFFSNGTHMSGMSSARSLLISGSLSASATNLMWEISRHRLAPVLWHYHETLRLLQHVSPNTAYDKIFVSGSGAAF